VRMSQERLREPTEQTAGSSTPAWGWGRFGDSRSLDPGIVLYCITHYSRLGANGTGIPCVPSGFSGLDIFVMMSRERCTGAPTSSPPAYLAMCVPSSHCKVRTSLASSGQVFAAVFGQT
jgi:hypothetical protein